jgi:hypothetical protein
MKSKNTYVSCEFIEKNYLEETISDDFGFDWEGNGFFEIIGEQPWDKTDSGIFQIDKVIDELVDLKNRGVNYVGCEYHCDHRELEIYGFKVTPATDEDIENHNKKIKEEEISKHKKEIEYHQSRINALKLIIDP